MIVDDARVHGCTINNGWQATGAGGFRTPDGEVVPGLHEILARVLPSDRRKVWLGWSSHKKVKNPKLRGCKVDHQLTAWANKGSRPAGWPLAAANRVIAWLEAHGLTAVRGQVPVYLRGVAGTAIDLLCHENASGRAVVIEVKTSSKEAAELMASYRLAPKKVP